MVLPLICLAALVADIDFSAHEPGAVRDRLHPDLAPGFARTEDAYGRRLGDALSLNPRLEYPRYAVGRDGTLSALRSGNALPGIPGSAPDPITLPSSASLPTNGPSTQLMWFYVYDPGELEATIRLCESQFGYQFGFRIDWFRAKWATDGGLSFIYGDGASSKSISTAANRRHSVLPADQWHLLAVVNDGAEFELFLDGVSYGKSPGNYRARGTTSLPVRLGNAASRACFKTDCYRIYDHALAAEEIQENWERGRPDDGAKPADETALLERRPSLKPNRHGLYVVGDKVDVTVDGKTVQSVTLAEPGLREIEFDGYKFPIGVLERKPDLHDIGAVEFLNRQPELGSLGVRRALLTANWRDIEPEKNDYDWTLLDRIADQCERRQVDMTFTITGQPAWYKADPEGNAAQARKFRALVEARYRAEIVEGSDLALVEMSNPATIATQIKKFREEGRTAIFLKTRPPGWQGKYSPAYEGRPSAALLSLGQLP